MKISFSDIQEQARQVRAEVLQQIPFAASLAVNWTGREAKAAVYGEMKRVFDRPNPYTLNALQLTPGTKDKPVATVWFRDQADVYLEPQVFGGARQMKRSELWMGRNWWVPSIQIPRDYLDAYGNVKGGKMTEMLAFVGALQDRYSNVTAASKKRNKRWGRYGYYIEWQGDKPLGLFRYAPGSEPVKILHFIKKPHYKPRLKFYDAVQNVVDKSLQLNFDRAIVYATRNKR